MDNQSLAHSHFNCTYHIVFIPKYRRKVMFRALRREVGEIRPLRTISCEKWKNFGSGLSGLGKVCGMENVTILKAVTLPEHVHMYQSRQRKVLQRP